MKRREKSKIKNEMKGDVDLLLIAGSRQKVFIEFLKLDV